MPIPLWGKDMSDELHTRPDNKHFLPIVEERMEVVVTANSSVELKRAVENLRFILQSYQRRTELNSREVRVVLRNSEVGMVK